MSNKSCLAFAFFLSLCFQVVLSNPLCIAHRGFSGNYDENTMESFEKAVESGCHGVEFDVMYTADKVPIIIHDETLDRTTNCTGLIRELNYVGDIEYCVSKNNKQKISTFTDMLEWLEKNSIFALVDMKTDELELIDTVCEIIMSRPYDFSSRLLLGGWSKEIVERISLKCQGFPISLIASEVPENSSVWDVANFNLEFKKLEDKPSFVREAHKEKKSIFVWTINDHKSMKDAFYLGVDGIVTDYPNQFFTTLDQVQQPLRNSPFAIVVICVLGVGIVALGVAIYLRQSKRMDYDEIKEQAIESQSPDLINKHQSSEQQQQHKRQSNDEHYQEV